MAETITLLLIENSFSSWTLAKLTPAILTVFGALFCGYLLYKLLKANKALKLTVALGIPGLLIGAYLMNNKPYVEDYAKSGVEINGRPHCMASAEKLSILKDRTPNRNIDLFLFTTKQEVVDEFKKDTNSFNLNYHTVHNEEAALNLCEGRFPAFIYIKNGMPIKRWFNNDFGYPAYDWVEADLE